MVERILTIATSALALYVTFREKVIGAEARASILMDITWCGLAACVLSALIVWGKQKVLYAAAQGLHDSPFNPGLIKPPQRCLIAGKVMIWTFFVALLSFTGFALVKQQTRIPRNGPGPLQISK